MKKSRVQLASNPFFGWFRVPDPSLIFYLFPAIILLRFFPPVVAHEQIKGKERYQLRQIKYSSPTIKNVQDANEKMGENQIESMRDVLKQDGEQIAKMVKNLQTLKKDLAL